LIKLLFVTLILPNPQGFINVDNLWSHVMGIFTLHM